MSEDFKAISEIANALSIIAVLLYAWTAERRERREIMAELKASQADHLKTVKAIKGVGDE